MKETIYLLSEAVLPGIAWSLLLWFFGITGFVAAGGKVRNRLITHLAEFFVVKHVESRAGQVDAKILMYQSYFFTPLITLIALILSPSLFRQIRGILAIISIFLPGLAFFFLKKAYKEKL